MRALLAAWLALFSALVAANGNPPGDFASFESGQTRPLALTADGQRLIAVNTPDNRVEVFHVGAAGLRHAYSIPVGLEPVAVAERGGWVWVVNHLSDSVSVIDARSATPRVVATLQVGDEPRDVVFAGTGRGRAFITTAHRGQNSPYTHPDNPGELTTPGIGRADVWVFDVEAVQARAIRKPLTIVKLFTDTPRALETSPDGNLVYAAGFHTGNQSTAIHEDAVCNGGASARPCLVNRSIAPGGVPGPNSADGRPGPETGLIVKYDGQAWRDSLGRSWNGQVRFTLPDSDLFAIDALAATPRVVRSWAHVGTVLYNLRANPKTGTLYVSNTEASNHIRFEGARPAGSVHTTVQGRAHQSRITVIDGDGVLPRHLNKHIDYRQRVAPPAVREKSLALPTGMAISDDGRTLYLAAFGSAKVGVFDTRELETDRFVPDRASQIELLAGGPSGLVLDEARGRLYVLTRFNNAVAVVDIASRKQIASHAMPNPEPASVVAGRRFLYDARYTSSNGEQACASCHVFGDTDSLGWDLGNPLGGMLNHPGEFRLGPIGNPDFHPLKGPMTTQSLRGLADSGSMHWRGDRTGGNDAPNVRPDGGSYDERAAFEQFNAAFVALLGRENALSDAEMRQFTDFALRIVYPPNPIRKLDNTLTPRQKQGEFLYFNALAEPVLNCNGCHQLDRAKNHFGTDGRFATQLLPQHLKVPHLRNVYQKVGMFGVANLANIAINDGGHKGEQIRGFGMLHDGALDTVFRHLHRNTFVPLGADGRRALEQFVFAYDSNLYPAVGQQVVLAPEYDAEDEARLALLEAQAAAGRCDLVVHGLVDGRPRGYLYGGDGLYRGDRCGEPAQTSAALRPWGPADGAMTFTCVPPGSGVRIALDRDRDGVLDGDDNCVASANADQADSNHDGVGDLCQDAPVGPPVLGAGAHCDATPGAPVATDERAPSLMDRLLPVLQFGNDLLFGTLLGLLGLNG